MNDYSQHGEGKIIADYFGDFKGHLISLGENDGKTLSNVLGLIEAGWCADLVEPSTQVFDKLLNEHNCRNKVNCWNFAITNHNGQSTFYDSGTHLNNGDLALLSSVKQSEINKWKKESFKSTEVACFTWNRFLEMACINKTDFISIDCEGMDFEILQQIDFTGLKVKAVCVEYNNKDLDKYVRYLCKHNLRLTFSNYCNAIFTLNKFNW